MSEVLLHLACKDKEGNVYFLTVRADIEEMREITIPRMISSKIEVDGWRVVRGKE